MDVQSLLFDRGTWTASKAKAWAKSHGYKYGKVHVTDQYIRIRQFDPKGSKVKRTIPFGRGIRAVVAREESSMRTSTVKAPRRKRRRTAKKAVARKSPRRRRARRVKALGVATRRKRRKVRVEAKRSSHRRRRARSPMVMEAKRRRRRPRRARAAEAWKGDKAGHAKAARKGHRRRRKAGSHRRKRRVSRETAVASPKRRRRSKRRVSRETQYTMESPRRSRRRYHARAASRGGAGMGAADLAIAVVSAGFGFVIADGLDRLLATYDPSATGDKPKDKFTSDGTGTLANTLNVAAMPNWQRVVAGVGLVAAPAVGSMYLKNGLVKSSVEGLAIGSGVSLFKTLWQNVIMPLLIGKDTSAPALQKSYIARLYPAEVAASINRASLKDKDGKLPPGPYNATGVLSDQPAPAADVGPFALAGDSPYPDAAQALRHAAGVSGDSPYPSAADALRAGVSGDSPYPDAAQALRHAAGVSAPWEPGPPPGVGPGPQAQPHTDPSCACLGDEGQYLGFVGDQQEETMFDTSAPA